MRDFLAIVIACLFFCGVSFYGGKQAQRNETRERVHNLSLMEYDSKQDMMVFEDTMLVTSMEMSYIIYGDFNQRQRK